MGILVQAALAFGNSGSGKYIVLSKVAIGTGLITAVIWGGTKWAERRDSRIENENARKEREKTQIFKAQENQKARDHQANEAQKDS